MLSLGCLAHENAGGRGGGTGLICGSTNHAVTIEEYELGQDASKLPESRLEIQKILLDQFDYDQSFLSVLIDRWEQLKDYDQWGSVERNAFAEALVGNMAYEQDNTVIKEIQNTLYELGVQLQLSSSNPLVGDDFFAVPANCKKVQLSILSQNLVKRFKNQNVTEKTKRYLELHEAFYSVGMQYFDHNLPFLTRGLIVSLVKGDRGGFKIAFKKFKRGNKEAHHQLKKMGRILKDGYKFRNGTDYLSNANSVYLLSSKGGMARMGESDLWENIQCPLAISITTEAGMKFTTFLEIKGHQVSVRHRSPQKQIPMGSRMGMTFYDPESPIFSNLMDILLGDARQIALLGYSKAAAKDQKIKYIPQDLPSESGKFYGITCQYYVYDKKNQMDKDGLVKVWNSIINSKD